MRVRVIRAFLHRGERQEPGATIELPDSLGREIVAMGKAERVVEPAAVLAPPAAEKPAAAAPPARRPMTTASASGLVPGAKE